MKNWLMSVKKAKGSSMISSAFGLVRMADLSKVWGVSHYRGKLCSMQGDKSRCFPYLPLL